MNNNQIKIGCEIFLKNKNSILLGKRKNCYGDSFWGLPGGHLEQGETLIDCAKRELKEELNIEGVHFKLISIAENIDKRGHYIHASFLVEEFIGQIMCMEPNLCYEWKFFNIDNLPDKIFDPHIKIINNFINNKLYSELD